MGGLHCVKIKPSTGTTDHPPPVLTMRGLTCQLAATNANIHARCCSSISSEVAMITGTRALQFHVRWICVADETLKARKTSAP